MLIRQQGFTLVEVLVALCISSMLLLGGLRLLPAMQLPIFHEYQFSTARESVWQLAYRIGKHLQRAGYCHGICTMQALKIEQDGRRVLIQWQAPGQPCRTQYEQTGYRLYQGELQILKNSTEYGREMWESISDPGLIILTDFSVTRQWRSNEPPLLVIQLTARQKQGGALIQIRHVVRGENL
ncbi:prepilin peptidase-dependent protein [Citrobacter sp. JGM124]|uniref:prepilin peptidase-dependent protein n=1 Tax=Citrobacter sp. JGM124 TaxID=2799789 RepID=UPI001BA48769|nr:prepilin peptidase-dependent protein [Citrobacter sp. JGM124]